MRHPVKSLPKNIDLWAFSRRRESLEGQISACQTKELGQWLATDDLIKVSLQGNIDNEQRHRLSGRIMVDLHMECQRCLEPIVWPIDTTFDYVLIAHEALEHTVNDGSETLVCTDQEFDLVWFFEEEILLAIPMIVKHDNCRPPLDIVGKQLPQATASDTKYQQPFADLKELLESKEQQNGRSTKS